MVLFYAYEQYCQQKAKKEDERIAKEDEEEEKEFNRLKELNEVVSFNDEEKCIYIYIYV